MDVTDPRTRHKVSLNPVTIGQKPTVLPQLLLSDMLLVLALHAGKTYLFHADAGVFWVLVRILACGAVGMIAWAVSGGHLRKKRTIEWSVLGMSSLLLFLRQAGLATALYRLPSTRVIVITHFSVMWLKSVLTPKSLLQTCAVAFALLVAFLSDANFSTENFREILPAYGGLALEAVAFSALDHTQGVLLPSLGEPLTVAMSTLGAFSFSLPLYMLRHVMSEVPIHSPISLTALSVFPFLAYVLLYQAPKAARAAKSPAFPAQYFLLSYALTLFASVTFGLLVFGRYPRPSDFLIASLLLYGVYPRISDPIAPSPYATSSRVIRAYLKSILSNPESRKIFYFLMLNMCYMLVQMMYGVWTNSLGLISDAIHMAFDCMAIGVGLIASVMARWPPNERFTYGYGRIETLSGFANGIFLILISLFIVFEAIQRLLDPPEMNTSQLLLVSSLGLAVNLFGMFAMGGHHHHGGHSHSHSHSHGHDNSDGHAEPTSSPTPDHGHSHDHHDHAHGDVHSHSHTHAHEESHLHSGSPPESPPIPAHHAHSHTMDPIINVSGMEPGSPTSPHPHFTRHAVHHSLSENELLVSNSPGTHADSPITPHYSFEHDTHYETHHSSAHEPNLHDHSHVHEHHEHEGHSHNMRGVFLHVMADTLGSVGVIISTLLIQWYGWTGFDPIASLFIAVLIAASVIPLVIDTGKVLALDVSDRETRIRDTLSELSSIKGLASYTSPRFWPKDDNSIIGSIHVQLAPSPSSYDPTGPHSTRRTTYANIDHVVERVDKLLRSRITGLEELTIQVEESSFSRP
ncbi:cation efflux protein [Laetiporus sulphureus 93-53]|uniref:Cation efflux protein n=1 Tax=Laetiporus sulphureus 93-53 TaxID=1314785 RepID=A0A165G6R0_9APHY|nr:cation efflux protein [Laetiporus sulphureus 93-53]KZT09903.1 cation efflux protein [Laetiporus sulphureus 93-53]